MFLISVSCTSNSGCTKPLERCENGGCKCSKNDGAFDVGDGTTKGSCSGATEFCQADGTCLCKKKSNMLIYNNQFLESGWLNIVF